MDMDTDDRADPPGRRDWPELRREALRRAGLSQADLAARIGVSRQSVGLVIADHHRSRRVEEAIAAAVGVDVGALFPTTRVPASDELTEPVPTRSLALPEPGEVPGREPDIPQDLTEPLVADLRAVAERVLLAIADGRVAADEPIVRAVAAALRELAR